MSISDLRRKTLSNQLRDELWRLIRTQKYAPGDRLPSEHQLAERFGVSRMTVREALKGLEDDHAIVCRHGVGRFVARAPHGVVQEGITSLKSVTQMANDQAIELTTQVVSCEERLAAEEEANALMLEPGLTVVELVRKRLSDGETMIYSYDVFPRHLVKGSLGQYDFAGSLFGIMREAWGVDVKYSRADLSAVMFDGADGEGASQQPWVLIEQVNHDQDDHPVLHSKDYHRGDMFRFHVVRRRR